jgi:hypothetical protein
MTINMNDAIAGAGLTTGMLSLILNWRQRSRQSREVRCLRLEIDRSHQECLGQISRVSESIEVSEKNTQSSMDLLRDGRLSMPARARALRMLRTGMAAETTATELGMARNEVRLLEKVAAVLMPRG